MSKEEKIDFSKDDLRTLDELKNDQELCKFYRNHSDEIYSILIDKNRNPRNAVEDLDGMGLPRREFMFIVQINCAIKRGNIKKSDL